MATNLLERPASKALPRKAISLRVPPNALALIDRAAELAHKDRTEFMLAAAIDRAEDTLLDQTSFRLSPDAFDAFTKALDNPPPPTPELIALMRRKPSWDR